MIYRVGLFFVILIFTGYILWSVLRPLKRPLQPTITNNLSTQQTSSTAPIQWAAQGEQALSVAGYNLDASHGEQKQVPIASIAKVMVALAVLDKKPLYINEQGPNITITDKDVIIYQEALAQDHSNIPVVSGEQITEYQALQALLLPSANNMAITLTNWAFGSQEQYLKFANNYAKQIGMSSTNFVDASGFNPLTTSTPTDLLILGEKALNNPIIAQIVNQKNAEIPVAGTITNVNTDLDINGINGIKTGNTLRAGGCLLFSSPIGDTNIIGVILGDTDLNQVLIDSQNLSKSATDNIQIATVVKTDQKVGEYKLPWGNTIDVVASKDISIAHLKNENINTTVTLQNINPGYYTKDNVGNISANYGNEYFVVPAKLKQQFTQPSIGWRLLHPSY